VNSSHVVVATSTANLLMLNNSGTIEWKQQHTSLGTGLMVASLNSNVYWMTQNNS